MRKMRKINLKLSMIILSIFMLSSCAVNRTVRYKDMNMNLFKIKNGFGLAILDHRIQVVDGSRKPSFVGYTRSGAGIAWPISTESGNNYSDDLTASVVSSLQKVEINVTTIKTNFKESEEDVKSKLFDLTNNTKTLIVLEELHSDGYGKQNLFHRIHVYIYDLDNKLIEYQDFDGKEKSGGTIAWGAGKYKEHLPRAVGDLFESILTDENVVKAINRQ
jgi:hypothetical protein